MAEIDPELVERAIRWCAEAGRQTTPAAVRVALGALTWDQLLAARALLADPPSLRPLGPFALADLARGAPADVAAERERAGGYDASLAAAEARSAGLAQPAPAPSAPAKRSRKGARAPFVVRRAGNRPGAPEPAPPVTPLVDELLLDEGRATLERLLRRHGGRRARLVAALAAGWRRADGPPIGSQDLDRLLAQHGLDRPFAIRERDEILHALRAAGGSRAAASAALDLAPEALDASVDRLGARGEAEKIREARRRALRARGMLTERAHALLEEEALLADLGLLEEFEADLRARLPEHLRALARAGRADLVERLAASLSLRTEAAEALLQRTGASAAEASPGGRKVAPAGGRAPRPEGAANRGRAPRPEGAASRSRGPRPEGAANRGRGPRPEGAANRSRGPRPEGAANRSRAPRTGKPAAGRPPRASGIVARPAGKRPGGRRTGESAGPPRPPRKPGRRPPGR